MKDNIKIPLNELHRKNSDIKSLRKLDLEDRIKDRISSEGKIFL